MVQHSVSKEKEKDVDFFLEGTYKEKLRDFKHLGVSEMGIQSNLLCSFRAGEMKRYLQKLLLAYSRLRKQRKKGKISTEA